jgi:TolC family type I secretion outer membrane protein
MHLLGKNKTRLLKLFYDHPGEQFYIQEIGRRLGKKPGVFQRTLNNLQKDGLVESEYKANARFFKINKNHPIYGELRSIVLKTAKLSIVIFLLFASTLNAEEKPLTLKDAITTAFDNNKDIQIQEKVVQIAKANILDATSNFLPHINLNASYTRNDKVLAENIFSGFKNDNQVGLSVTESVYNGGADIANFKQAQIGLNVQEETLRAKKLDVEFDAKRLYYGLLLAYEAERIALDLVNEAEEHYKNVKDKFDHGTASRFDTLQSKVKVALLMPQLVSARNDIDYIKAELNKLLGRKIDTSIQTDEKLEYSPIEIREGEFLQAAYLNKPELILQVLGVDISKWSIEMAKSGYRPDISIQASVNNRSDNTGDIFKSEQSNWNAGVSVSIPIFEGFSTKAKVDAARAQYAQATLTKDNLVDQIAVDIRKSCLDLDKAESIILAQKDNIDEAREALKISEISYDAGVGINLDVIDSQVSLAQVRQNLASGIYDYLMAEAYLDRNMGKSYITEAVNEKNPIK